MAGYSSTGQPLCSASLMQSSETNFFIWQRGISNVLLLLEGSGASGAILKQQSIFKDLFQRTELQNWSP